MWIVIERKSLSVSRNKEVFLAVLISARSAGS
jgi:hypothetical protein